MRYSVLMIVFVCFLTGCRGWRTEKPPIHLNPNLDFQASIKSQEQPLLSPVNTIPWGNESSFNFPDNRDTYLESNPLLYRGQQYEGTSWQWINTIPLPVNYEFLSRGRERFDIFCSVCHGKDGSGNGSINQRAWIKPVSYWDERVVAYKDGELFDIITHGIRTMPSYSQQISAEDRWAIVAYVRALQISHAFNIDDVPVKLRTQIK